MTDTPAQRALAASTVALLVALGCAVMFLPPLASFTVTSVPRTVLVGLALAGAIGLHWIFVGIAASRMSRSVAGWVALAVLLFPLGGAMALILLNWFGDESAPPSPTAQRV